VAPSFFSSMMPSRLVGRSLIEVYRAGVAFGSEEYDRDSDLFLCCESFDMIDLYEVCVC